MVSRQQLTCGTACAAALLKELEAREREAGIKPDAGVDAFLRARLRGGITGSMSTEMVLSLLGLTASSLCTFRCCWPGASAGLGCLAATLLRGLMASELPNLPLADAGVQGDTGGG